MRKTLLAATAAALALVATPALAADNSGARVGITGGVIGNDVLSTDEAIFGVEAGYDFDLGNVVVGATASYEDAFEGGNDDLISATARVGVPVGPVLAYATGGYANASGNDGYRIGGGVEFAVTGNMIAKVEHRYTDLGSGVNAHSTVLGLGLRF